MQHKSENMTRATRKLELKGGFYIA